jgi:hypothetical protein
MIIIATLVSLVVFLTFTLYIYFKYGVLTSISMAWYVLPKKEKLLFTLFCFVLGTSLLFQGGLFFFLSGAGLFFVGAATDYESKTTNIVHFTGALVGILSALIGLWVEYGLFYPLIIAIALSLIIYLIKMKNYLWWIEIVAFLSIIIGLFLK